MSDDKAVEMEAKRCVLALSRLGRLRWEQVWNPTPAGGLVTCTCSDASLCCERPRGAETCGGARAY